MNESPKKPGRKPIGPKAMTPARRKQEQRLAALTRIAERDNHEWKESDCLMVLQMAKFRNRWEAEAAWEQLGRLRLFGDNHDIPLR